MLAELVVLGERGAHCEADENCGFADVEVADDDEFENEVAG